MKQIIVYLGYLYVFVMTVVIIISMNIHILKEQKCQLITTSISYGISHTSDLELFKEELERLLIKYNLEYKGNVIIDKVESVGDMIVVKYKMEYINFNETCVLDIERYFYR